jgi:carbamoyl-phosphate synthase large subunit
MAILQTAFVFYDLGFKIMATSGTATFLEKHGIVNERVNKVREGRPDIVDMIKNGRIDLVINTTSDKKAISESYSIRRTALTFDIPYTTTLAGAKATALAIKAMKEEKLEVKTLQEYHERQA